MSANASIHTGHRQRLKERFSREGLENFDEIHALELLLFYCVQRKDTNPLSHRLLNHFGNLTNVLEADREELLQVEGVTENVAVFLSLILQLHRHCEKERSKKQKILHGLEECAQYLQNYFSGCQLETVYMLCLDAKCKVICCKRISQGGVNSTPLSVRKVVEAALLSKATSVVLAHNHPSGFAVPSVEDVQVTRQVGNALRAVDVILADHLIFGDAPDDDPKNRDYVSLAESKLYIPELREGVQLIGSDA